MTISVALCTYNGERFLCEQLDSIAQQTLLPDELVVCDDCSKDSTFAILEEFKQKASFPVHIHLNETNLGSNRNFEKAISLCSGDFIALCDQDDVWKPHKLERLHAALQANPEAGYAFSDAELVDEHRRLLGNRLWAAYGFRGKFKELFFKGKQFQCLVQHNVVTGATMVFRAKLREIAMPLPQEGAWVHDEWIAFIATAIGQLGVPLDEALILYRIHPQQQIGVPEQQVGVPGGKAKGSSLWRKFCRELQMDHQTRITARERQYCLRPSILKEVLQQYQEKVGSLAFRQNLAFLEGYDIYTRNQTRIMKSKGLARYGLILREAFSGRYALYANSWQTMVRDFLF